MRRFLTIMTLILSASYYASAQDIMVNAKLDSSHITIGDQLHYIITVDQPSGVKLLISEHHDTLCKGVEIVSGPVIDTISSQNGKLIIANKYLVTSFDSGYYQIPPAFAEYSGATGIKRFYSEYSPLNVSRPLVAPQDSTAKIFDIVKPYKAPVSFGEILPWLLILIAAAFVVWGLIILVRKVKKRDKPEEPAVNPDPAHVIAFRELEKLREEKLWENGEIKLYYTKLTEILRQYIENRYGVCSLEMTTSETLAALVKTGFRKDKTYESLKTILNGSDLVKFAKYKPEPDENREHFDNSWKFVEMTMIHEVPLPENIIEERKEGNQ
jgi:hypothetical protein